MLALNPIERLWRWRQRRQAIRRYLRRLPRLLLEDFGHRGPYNRDQVLACIRRHKVSSPEYAEYAVALFCDAVALGDLQRQGDLYPDHAGLRRELSETYFGGTDQFSLMYVARSCAEHSGGGYEAGHHGGDLGGGQH